MMPFISLYRTADGKLHSWDDGCTLAHTGVPVWLGSFHQDTETGRIWWAGGEWTAREPEPNPLPLAEAAAVYYPDPRERRQAVERLKEYVDVSTNEAR